MYHSWDVTPKEAVAIQKDLKGQVTLENVVKEINHIAGADISFDKGSAKVFAGIVILKYPEMNILARSLVISEAKFPYIPGLLSFREVPSLPEAWKKLTIKPDVILMDGQGIAHPRRLGIASHFGILTGCPAIGCAKSLLTGNYLEPDVNAGEFSMVYDKEEPIGYALRTKTGIKPIFVSPGHKIDFEGSKNIVLNCVTKYRLPEPMRQVHILVNKLRRGELETGP